MIPPDPSFLWEVKKYLLFFSLFTLLLTTYGQHRVNGKIINENEEDIGFCHVFNQTLNSGKVADMQGRFELLARKNDTIRFSYVGYQSYQLVVSSVHLVNYLKITLTEDSLLLPSITIYADKYYKVPLNMTGEPIIIPGVSLINPPERIKPGDFRPGGGSGIGGIPLPGVTIEGPITYFSKDEQEKRQAVKAYQETQETITYQIYIAQDSVRKKLCKLYRINQDQYDEVLIRLHSYWPDIQKSYRPQEIWNWLLVHFDRTVPVVRR